MSKKWFAIPKQVLIYATYSKNLSTKWSYPEGLLSNIFRFATHIMQQVNSEQCWKENKLEWPYLVLPTHSTEFLTSRNIILCYLPECTYHHWTTALRIYHVPYKRSFYDPHHFTKWAANIAWYLRSFITARHLIYRPAMKAIWNPTNS
jgi:hypothetical protein